MSDDDSGTNGRKEAGRMQATLDLMMDAQAVMSGDVKVIVRELGEVKIALAVLASRLGAVEKEIECLHEHTHPDICSDIDGLRKRDAWGTAGASLGAAVAAVIAIFKS